MNSTSNKYWRNENSSKTQKGVISPMIYKSLMKGGPFLARIIYTENWSVSVGGFQMTFTLGYIYIMLKFDSSFKNPSFVHAKSRWTVWAFLRTRIDL